MTILMMVVLVPIADIGKTVEIEYYKKAHVVSSNIDESIQRFETIEIKDHKIAQTETLKKSGNEEHFKNISIKNQKKI